MPNKTTQSRADDLLNFIGALVKEHASLRLDDGGAQPVFNRKPAKRAEPHESTHARQNTDGT